MDTPLIRPNRLKRLLAEGKTPVGVFLIEFRQTAVLQILANCGFDFVVIDNEHGVFGIETIAELSRAARLLDLAPGFIPPGLARGLANTDVLTGWEQPLQRLRAGEPAHVAAYVWPGSLPLWSGCPGASTSPITKTLTLTLGDPALASVTTTVPARDILARVPLTVLPPVKMSAPSPAGRADA